MKRKSIYDFIIPLLWISVAYFVTLFLYYTMKKADNDLCGLIDEDYSGLVVGQILTILSGIIFMAKRKPKYSVIEPTLYYIVISVSFMVIIYAFFADREVKILSLDKELGGYLVGSILLSLTLIFFLFCNRKKSVFVENIMYYIAIYTYLNIAFWLLLSDDILHNPYLIVYVSLTAILVIMGIFNYTEKIKKAHIISIIWIVSSLIVSITLPYILYNSPHLPIGFNNSWLIIALLFLSTGIWLLFFKLKKTYWIDIFIYWIGMSFSFFMYSHYTLFPEYSIKTETQYIHHSGAGIVVGLLFALVLAIVIIFVKKRDILRKY